MRKLPSFLLVVILPPLLTGCAAAVLGGLATGAYVAQDRRSIGSLVDDQVLEVKISNALRADPQAGYGRIIVSSFNGNVLLVGDVPSQAAKDNAARIAKQQLGVKQVYNELNVGPIAPASDSARDTWIRAEVKTRLLGAEDHPGLKVKVTVDKGIVYLQGLVSRDEGNWAASVASNVSGVKQVVKVFEYTS